MKPLAVSRGCFAPAPFKLLGTSAAQLQNVRFRVRQGARNVVLSVRCLALAHACCNLASYRRRPRLYGASSRATPFAGAVQSVRLLAQQRWALAPAHLGAAPWEQAGPAAPRATSSRALLGIGSSLPALVELREPR